MNTLIDINRIIVKIDEFEGITFSTPEEIMEIATREGLPWMVIVQNRELMIKLFKEKRILETYYNPETYQAEIFGITLILTPEIIENLKKIHIQRTQEQRDTLCTYLKEHFRNFKGLSTYNLEILVKHTIGISSANELFSILRSRTEELDMNLFWSNKEKQQAEKYSEFLLEEKFNLHRMIKEREQHIEQLQTKIKELTNEKL
jgi:hypothetical protein